MVKTKQPGGKSAFTLVEILLVIVIIGVMAGALVMKLSGRTQEARLTRAQADIRGTLSTALDVFEQDLGRYPTTEEGLEALASDPGVSGWKGPYLKSGLKPDPWGNPYHYENSPDDPSKYRLVCAGPDGNIGTSDDIVP